MACYRWGGRELQLEKISGSVRFLDVLIHLLVMHSYAYITELLDLCFLHSLGHNTIQFYSDYRQSIVYSYHRCWSRKFAWKVADGVATHSKPYWFKGGGWLIIVDISYTTLHKRTGEEGWLATLSTPLWISPCTMTTTRCNLTFFNKS